MEFQLFLLIIGIIWIIFATIQDMKTREVANWLTYSLVVFSFAYLVVYSYELGDWNGLIFGTLGFLFFTALAFALYYGKAIAGGDAKLLMGIGVILPYSDLADIVPRGTLFILMLLGIGAVYSVIYSIFLVYKNREGFGKEFNLMIVENKWLFLLPMILSIIMLFISGISGIWLFGTSAIFLIPLLYSYLQAVEKKCLIVKLNYKNLSEGDWLLRDINVGGREIKENADGLSLEEIDFLRKKKYSPMIKQGIPFVPVFLISMLLMVFFDEFFEFGLRMLKFLF